VVAVEERLGQSCDQPSNTFMQDFAFFSQTAVKDLFRGPVCGLNDAARAM